MNSDGLPVIPFQRTGSEPRRPHFMKCHWMTVPLLFVALLSTGRAESPATRRNFVQRGEGFHGGIDVSIRSSSFSIVRPRAFLASTSPPWFHRDRLSFFIILLIVGGSIIAFIQIARSGRPLYIRKIAGLDAVEEAVGRATEMGRKILFIPGIEDMNDIQTVAGINVLGRVARVAAEYGAELEVPARRSLMMTVARETVSEAYLSAGRPDAYQPDRIHYVTDEQFAFAAAVSGAMVRDRPAACFYMGTFYAESLILAETGHSIGAIQLAGTAETAQLPFFVAAADYTLIGEEFFAASAYLSGEPAQRGSLKGQDVGKLIAAGLILMGFTLAMIGGVMNMEWARTSTTRLISLLTSS